VEEDEEDEESPPLDEELVEGLESLLPSLFESFLDVEFPLPLA
jgi:hypothetical protein